MQLAGSTNAANKSIGPPARNERGSQNDNGNFSVSPVVKDFEVFKQFVAAGQRLAEIHVRYEQQPEYPLKKIETSGEQLDYRVKKMKLSKDKTQLIYNKFLTLDGIPLQTYEYRLGTPRSNGSSINTRSPPTSAAASPTIPTATTIHPTSSVSSPKSSA